MPRPTDHEYSGLITLVERRLVQRVGWVERSDTHHAADKASDLGYLLSALSSCAPETKYKCDITLHFYSVYSAMMGIAALNAILQRVSYRPLLAGCCLSRPAAVVVLCQLAGQIQCK